MFPINSYFISILAQVKSNQLDEIPRNAQNFTLEHMKMGSRDSYICLIPKAPEHIPPPPEDDSNADTTPARSWALLQPLAGKCLYVCTTLPSKMSVHSNLIFFTKSIVKDGSLIPTVITMKFDNSKNLFPSKPV